MIYLIYILLIIFVLYMFRHEMTKQVSNDYDAEREEALRKIKSWDSFYTNSGQFDTMKERAEHRAYYEANIKPLKEKYKDYL